MSNHLDKYGLNTSAIILVAGLLSTGLVHAGAYIFADEANLDEIVHPGNYTGAESVVTVRVCIDPASPNAAEMELPVQNNINIFNRMQPTIANVVLGGSNNVPSGNIDFESVSLHEMGHCLGLAHVNLASESGQTGGNQNYTKSTDGADNIFNLALGADGKVGSRDDVRGDDVNLHWFRISNNDPFTIDSIVDKTTYSMDITDLPTGDLFAANGERSLSVFLGLPRTEAIMQQGTFFDEAQRSMIPDDVATLLYAASGLDEQAGTADDYEIQLEYGGISSTNCDISMSITTTTGLAFCSVTGSSIGTTGPNAVFNHTAITSANIEFGDGFSWFFNPDSNNQAPVLTAIGSQSMDELDSLQIDITTSDGIGDDLTIVASNLPAFSAFVDNGDGTATLNIDPVLGDASTSMVTITVNDNGLPQKNAQEVFQLTVNALDSDGDGLSDFDELTIYLTDPADADSDNDFINDGVEVTEMTDPNDINDFPNFADGDIAPLGAPDGLVNAADYALAQRIALGEVNATTLELAHGDLYPVMVPDGVIDLSDVVLLLQLVQ